MGFGREHRNRTLPPVKGPHAGVPSLESSFSSEFTIHLNVDIGSLPVASAHSLTSLPFHPQKKCKNCGAFGHTDRDTKCFMKRWKEALIPQNFGKKEGKENLKPWKSQVQGNPGPLNKEKGEKEERPR